MCRRFGLRPGVSLADRALALIRISPRSPRRPTMTNLPVDTRRRLTAPWPSSVGQKLMDLCTVVRIFGMDAALKVMPCLYTYVPAMGCATPSELAHCISFAC
jgi:hypothetical protein